MEYKKPICGILSVAMPLIALLLGLLGSLLIHKPPGPHHPGVLLLLTLSLLFLVSGIALSIAAMVRRERLRWLPAFGLVWNLGWALSFFVG